MVLYKVYTISNNILIMAMVNILLYIENKKTSIYISIFVFSNLYTIQLSIKIIVVLNR